MLCPTTQHRSWQIFMGQVQLGINPSYSQGGTNPIWSPGFIQSTLYLLGKTESVTQKARVNFAICFAEQFRNCT